MKLRNVNRGLVLGAVLVLGTAVYVGVDNARFKDSKPEIEETVKKSVEAITQSNIGQADQIESNWHKLLADYFTGYSNIHDYGTTRDYIYSEISGGNIVEEDMGRITKAMSEVSNISISKSGSDGATVEFEFSSYYEYTGSSPAYMSFNGLNFLDGGDSYDEYGNPILGDENAVYGETVSGEASMYLLKTDSGWKIASMENYGYGIDIKRLDEGGGADAENGDDNSETSVDDTMPAADDPIPEEEAPAADEINGGGELS